MLMFWFKIRVPNDSLSAAVLIASAASPQDWLNYENHHADWLRHDFAVRKGRMQTGSQFVSHTWYSTLFHHNYEFFVCFSFCLFVCLYFCRAKTLDYFVLNQEGIHRGLQSRSWWYSFRSHCHFIIIIIIIIIILLFFTFFFSVRPS